MQGCATYPRVSHFKLLDYTCSRKSPILQAGAPYDERRGIGISETGPRLDLNLLGACVQGRGSLFLKRKEFTAFIRPSQVVCLASNESSISWPRASFSSS